MIDFPASPTNGQLFNASNGGTYQWNGTIWLPIGNTTATIYVGDTPPASPIANQFWFNSALGQTFLWFNDGNTTQWVPANPQQLGPPAAQSIMLYHSSASVGTTTTSTTMAWDTVAYNSTGGTYSAGTFTVPSGMGGVWDVCFQGLFVVANYTIIALHVNGVNSYQVVGASNVAGANTILSGKFVFAAGDAIRIQISTGAAGTMTCTSGVIRSSWLHLTRVGA